MFKTGDTVLYGGDGVCTISEITLREFGDISIEYYVLVPVFDNRSKFFVPTKNPKLVSRMQSILPPDDIYKLICGTKELEWIENDTQRLEFFKEILSNGGIESVVGVIKCISAHKDNITRAGKKLHKADEIIFKDTLKVMYEQMALFFDITKDAVEDIVCQKISFDDLVKKTV